MRILLAISALLISHFAHAEWDIGGGLESYRWIEYPEGFSGTPKESGFREALFVNWTQEREQGLLFAWRAKIYAGTVNYDTFYLTAPYGAVSTKTGYVGAASEGQMLYRTGGPDFLSGIGLDFWSRDIGNNGNQIEDYSILYVRAGLGLVKSRTDTGFHGQLGIKYPVSTNEDAHLKKQGFTSNPALKPKGAVSGYAEFGYRINPRFDLLAYYDSWRFRRSDSVTVADTSATLWNVWQPKSNMDALGIKLLVSF